MCLVGAVSWLRGGLIFISQIFGAVAASGLVSVLYPGQLNVRTTLGAGTSHTQGLFIEMFLTAMLVFTIFMLAAEKHKGTFIAPIGIGLSLFIAELGGKKDDCRDMTTTNLSRRLLHRWQSEPRQILRPLRCRSHL